MSKCRPISGIEFTAITDFLRSVHINGQPLQLPGTIDAIHANPRQSFELAKTLNTPSMQQEAVVFEATEAATASMSEKIAALDKRLDEMLARLSAPRP